MSYYEEIVGTITFHPSTSMDYIDSVADKIDNYFGDCSSSINDGTPSIDFSVYDNRCGDFIEDLLQNQIAQDDIKAAYAYICGEGPEDWWRIRKVEGESGWRREVGTLVYEGEDVPLFNGSTDEKCTVSKDALVDIL